MKRLVVGVAAMLMCGVGFADIGPASAEVYTCGSPGNYFDGMWNPQSAYFGVSATITVRYGAVCDTDHSQYNPTSGAVGNFVTAWSMLADSGGHGWLQSGFIRAYGQALIDVSQFYNPHFYGGPVTIFGAQRNAGEVHRYWQQYYPDAQGEFHSNVDTTRLINTSTGVLTYGWSGFSQQFFGEAHYRESDMPGGATYPTSFSSLQVQNAVASFIPIPSPFLAGSNIDNPARWSYAPTSSTSFGIWTYKYS